jgi:hypothetical protein
MDRHKAIRNTHPTVVTINVSDSGTEAWDKDGNVVVLNESLITAEMTELQAVYDGLAYQRTRHDAYADVKEQLDQLYHDMAADKGDKTGEWFKAVKKVKDDNAKE